MTEYGAVHELVVEHEDQGRWEDDPQEKGRHEVFMHEVRYILRHPPEGCWDDTCSCAMTESSLRACKVHGENGTLDRECPILQAFDDAGMTDSLGVTRWTSKDGRFQNVIEHLQDGLYHVQCWHQHYSGPNGDDWDGGIYVDRVIQDPPPRPKLQGFHLLTAEEI